jgi:hypothetical protein
MGRGVAVHETDAVGDTEFGGPLARRGQERCADVDADSGDLMIAGPGRQHLALAAAQVQHRAAGPQPDRVAESGEFVLGDRVEDLVTALPDGETTWQIQCSDSSQWVYGSSELRADERR